MDGLYSQKRIQRGTGQCTWGALMPSMSGDLLSAERRDLCRSSWPLIQKKTGRYRWKMRCLQPRSLLLVDPSTIHH